MRHADGNKILFHARVGESIRAARLEAGKSVRVFAELVGISANTLERIEDGITPCPLYVLAQIAEALDVTLDELVPTEALV